MGDFLLLRMNKDTDYCLGKTVKLHEVQRETVGESHVSDLQFMVEDPTSFKYVWPHPVFTVLQQ